ncbi:HD-GYP domain-containing protein [Vallitalea okinawensis]|uniref:HD-GYP domain-containing protein n=1 Tax=Vallitalea okinawensis TaxID=2078660 RepID=UPI000CFC5A51|nr:HD-GYP domain-containing protein [Vallitalea okinawensis]
MSKISLDKSLLRSLTSLASVIEARDAYTGGHIWRVSQYSKILASKAGLDKGQIFLAELGGLVHDLGKVGIPDAILNKPGRLTDIEYDTMKTHTTLGKNLASNHPLAPLIEDAIYKHHERIDGYGYNGSKEKEISIIPRVVGIADAFDAMTSTRPYRKGMDKEKAIDIIHNESGKQFDKKLAEIFVSLASEEIFSRVLGFCGEEKPLIECPGCGPIISYSHDHKDGDILACPTCRGLFVLHTHKDSFEIECKGEQSSSQYIPEPDQDTVEYFVKSSPKKIKI